MPFAVKLVTSGKWSAAMEADVQAGRRAVTTVVKRKTAQLERRMKSHVASRLGTPISKSARSATYPRRGVSLGAAGEVYFLASRKANTGQLDIIELFGEGARVTPKNAKFLWVPTAEGRRLGGAPKNKPRSLTPQTFTGGRLLFLPSRSRRARVAGRMVLRQDPTVTVFVALRRVTLRRKLRLPPILASVMRNYSQLVFNAWDRNLPTELRRAQVARRAR